MVRPHVAAYWNQVPTEGRAPHAEFLTSCRPRGRSTPSPTARCAGVGETLRNPDMAATLRACRRAGRRGLLPGRDRAPHRRRHAGPRRPHHAGRSARRPRPRQPSRCGAPIAAMRIATNRPPGGGVMLIEMLNILEHFDLKAMGHNSPDYIATVAEAMKIATVDKDAKVGDPRFVDGAAGRARRRRTTPRRSPPASSAARKRTCRASRAAQGERRHDARRRRRRERRLRDHDPHARHAVGRRHRGPRLHVQRRHGGVRSAPRPARLAGAGQVALLVDGADDRVQGRQAVPGARRAGRHLHRHGHPAGDPQRRRVRHDGARGRVARRASMPRRTRSTSPTASCARPRPTCSAAAIRCAAGR